MKNLILFIAIFSCSVVTTAQNTGIGTATPHASAMLDIQSTNRGFLLPRMTATQRLAIANAATGLMVYDTDSSAFMQKNAGGWVKLQNTNDVLWWKNANNIFNSNIGNVGIGTTTPTAKLEVAGQVKITGGTPGAGKVLTSDANGLASWQATSSGGSSAWATTGNTNNNIGAFLGTNDKKPLIFKVNGTIAGKIDTTTDNTSFGFFTMPFTTGGLNSAFGAGALASNNSGSWNTALGRNALYQNQTGVSNTAVGVGSLESNKVGNNNVAVGVGTLQDSDDFNNNVAVGARALAANHAHANTAVGYEAARGNISGVAVTAVGNAALRNSITNNNLTAIGDSALANNGIGASGDYYGENNTAIGAKAMKSNTIGWQNTVVGAGALQNSTTGTYNSALGVNALTTNTTGDGNTALGVYAMNFNTTGFYNTAVGTNALVFNQTGMHNVAIGNIALAYNTTGGFNIGIGDSSLSTNISGTNNTAIGNRANVGAANLTNATAIGANAVVNTSNSLVLGNNANVGIGTNSPGALLDVFHNADIWHSFIGGSTGRLLFGGQAGNGSVIQSWNPTTNLSRDLYLQRDGGNVGIGTNNATSKLDIVENNPASILPSVKLTVNNSDNAIRVYKNGAGGNGIYVNNNVETGNKAGIIGITRSNTGRSTGVVGIAGNDGSGLHHALTVDMVGVEGLNDNASSGYGVIGRTKAPSGAGVVASYSGVGTGNALQIENGFIRVAGPTRTAFTVTGTADNTSAHVLNLNYANAAASDIVIATHNYNPNNVGGSYHNAPTGVYWTGSTWAIFSEDSATPMLGKSFNVMVIKQ